MLEATIHLDLDAILVPLVREAVEQALAARDSERPFDSKAAAEYLGVSRRRMHDLVNEGRLPRRSDGPGCKLWFLKADLDAYAGG